MKPLVYIIPVLLFLMYISGCVDVVGAGLRAGTGLSYTTIDDESTSLPNSTACISGKWVCKFEDFLGGSLVGTVTILGVQTVLTTDADIFGEYNFATGTVIDNDAGFSVGGTTDTGGIKGIYNASNVTLFETRINLTDRVTQNTTIGLINTTVSQSLSDGIRDGIFFNFSNITGEQTTRFWYIRTCVNNACTSVNTTILPDTTNFHTYKINRSLSNYSNYSFYYDDAFLGSWGETIPTNANRVNWIGVLTETKATNARNIKVDYVRFIARR